MSYFPWADIFSQKQTNCFRCRLFFFFLSHQTNQVRARRPSAAWDRTSSCEFPWPGSDLDLTAVCRRRLEDMIGEGGGAEELLLLLLQSQIIGMRGKRVTQTWNEQVALRTKVLYSCVKLILWCCNGRSVGVLGAGNSQSGKDWKNDWEETKSCQYRNLHNQSLGAIWTISSPHCLYCRSVLLPGQVLFGLDVRILRVFFFVILCV